ncbi:MAG: DUF3592 domain-containing protein [Kiritimatiellaeota bacterium]|nr:DUF3592 domain-containing protein [Kiritimatiellota bacterium]
MRFEVKQGAKRGNSWGGLLFFALFWCTLTGVFVGFVVYSFWHAAAAQLRYQSAEGTVLESRVTSSQSDGSTTYGFGIRYRYTVGGQSFEGDRYAFGSGSSSDGHGRASQLVKQHPIGSKLTVYYDPAKPQQSVIERHVDPMMKFLLLFLQPFVLVGVGLIGALVKYPFNRRRIAHFLQRPADVPWKIPSWGTLERGFAGFTLQPKPTLSGTLLALLFGYGLTSFASIFVVGFLFGGFSGGKPNAILGAFIVCVLGGILGVVLYRNAQRSKARLVLDPGSGTFKLTSKLRTLEVAFDEIAGWSLKQILNPRNVKQEGQNAYVPLLSIHTTKGGDVPVHVFAADDDASAVAQKVAETFASWTNKPIFEEPPPSTSDVLKLMTPSGMLAAAREIKAVAAQLKDLC